MHVGMWKIGNKKLALLKKKTWNRFLRFKNIAKYDELNIIKGSKELYKDLDAMNKETLRELAKEVYADVSKEYFDVVLDDISMHSVAIKTNNMVTRMLSESNEITKYIYNNEVDRKRSRLAENLIVDKHKSAIEGNSASLRDLQRNYNVWVHQAEQYIIDIEKQATVECYKDNGVKKVRWVTQKDANVCKFCMELDGLIFDVDKVPPQLHDNCRCGVEPLEKEDNDNEDS